MPPTVKSSRERPIGGEDVLREHALVRDVVDREQRRRADAEVLQVLGDERGRPVVDVNEVGRRAALGALLDDLGGGAREHREAHGVVRVVLAAIAVDAGAVEQAGRVEEDEVDLRRQAAVVDGDLVGLAAELERERREPARQEEAGLLERGEPRHHDGDLVAERLQHLRERGAHVGEAADFDERRELGGDEQDLHRGGFYHFRAVGMRQPSPALLRTR